MDVQIVIQLWQIVVSAVIVSGGLIALGSAIGSTFVKRSECNKEHVELKDRNKKTDETITKIFERLDKIGATLSFMEGQQAGKQH